MWEGVGSRASPMFIDLAGGCPEACQRAKSTRPPAGSPECESVGATKEGTRAPNDRHPIFKSGSLSAPASVACRAEGAVTSSARLRSCRSTCAGLHRRRTTGRCARNFGCDERRCRRASVRTIAGIAQPRSPAPESEGATPRVSRCDGAAPASTGHRPCPASAAQLLRPWVGQGCEAVWGRLGGRGLV